MFSIIGFYTLQQFNIVVPETVFARLYAAGKIVGAKVYYHNVRFITCF